MINAWKKKRVEYISRTKFCRKYIIRHHDTVPNENKNEINRVYYREYINFRNTVARNIDVYDLATERERERKKMHIISAKRLFHGSTNPQFINSKHSLSRAA